MLQPGEKFKVNSLDFIAGKVSKEQRQKITKSLKSMKTAGMPTVFQLKVETLMFKMGL